MRFPALEHVRISEERDTTVLVLDRPDSNALSVPVLRDLVAALDAVSSDDRLRPVVITGAGRAFSTGGDLESLLETLERGADASVAELDASLALLGEVIRRVHGLRPPTIAAINGQAAGAGFSLALACDVRIASERAVLNFAYGALGTSPDGGMTWFLPRIVSPGRASQLLLEQPVLRAPSALAEGLVSEVVPHESLLGAALKRSRRLAAKAPHSIRTARSLVDVGTGSSLEEQLEHERAAFAVATLTEDFREGVTATIAGRRADFTGR